ncbi:hypothetical protein PHYPSEUDO_005300 [Phytophthora pseudosyringae]|uniref:EF-hand domain-containing protein n=1 Tax=Phytophthora pseudosyringae TaxID=221518 RepID=A0A8T1VMC9_9STRA|nr:hypothetical protein PHYPSEUDO_005300 [Phytophthora pseudosyringae]
MREAAKRRERRAEKFCLGNRQLSAQWRPYQAESIILIEVRLNEAARNLRKAYLSSRRSDTLVQSNSRRRLGVRKVSRNDDDGLASAAGRHCALRDVVGRRAQCPALWMWCTNRAASTGSARGRSYSYPSTSTCGSFHAALQEGDSRVSFSSSCLVPTPTRSIKSPWLRTLRASIINVGSANWFCCHLTRAAVKKLSRYCCNNCGGSDLYLYCWKGCRHVQNIKTFYAETKSIQHELEMLRVTIYEQEIRIREYELQLKEKQESLEFLASQVSKLPRFYPVQSFDDLASMPLGLPAWSVVAAKMVWRQFDGDHDGKLTSEELRGLKDQLRTNHENVDAILPDYPAEPLTPYHFLQLYECGEGSKLSDDLRSLGILCAAADVTSLSKAKRELASVKHALLDLRALVDDQIAEKEKWQRYCWDVEERLHEATNASHIKERDLWRTKDARKEESRKNMLLYIEAQKGKRHFDRPAEPTGNPTLESKHPSYSAKTINADLDLRSLGNNNSRSPNQSKN